MFNIGDKVRFKNDSLNKYWSVVNIYPSISKVQILSDCGNIAKVVEPLLLVPYDPVSDLKQAIREVLLSDEFLAAFAKAWQSIIHNEQPKFIVADDIRPYKSWGEIANQSPPVIINNDSLDPITGSESEAYYLNKLKNGESK